MFQIPPTPRQLAKFDNKNTPESLQIPQNWADFAALSQVKSGNQIKSFQAFDYQIAIADLMAKYNCVFIKSRQTGCSTLVLSVVLHRACLNPAYSALIFSKRQEDSSELARRIEEMCKSANIELEIANLHYIKVKHGGVLRFMNSRPDASRSADSISDIIYDEAGYIDELDAIQASAAPTQLMVGEDSRTYYVSTPNGINNIFHSMASQGLEEELTDICDKVVAGIYPPFYYQIDNFNWCHIWLHWTAHPVYSKRENFLEEERIKSGSTIEKMKKDYQLSFTDANDQYFDQAILNSCKRTGVKKNHATPGNIYYIGIDPNSGGKDYCSVTVLEDDDSGKLTKVHGYRKNRGTSIQHINEIKVIIDRFKVKGSNLYVGVEVNGAGQAWLERLDDEKYFGEYQKIFTNKDNKAGMLARCKVLHEQQRLLADETDTYWQDASNLREIGDQIKAAEGKNSHDDECMSMAIAVAVANSKGFK